MKMILNSKLANQQTRKGGDEVSCFTKNRRIYAFLTAFFVTAVLFLSVLFIVTHVEHDCTGEGCFVCTEIEACVCTICLLAEAVGAGAVVIFAYIAIQKLLSSYPAGRYLCPVSLVSLKIRLDD